MSNKTGGIDRKKNRQKNSGMEITGQLTEYVLAIVIMILCLAVLFYAKDGYHQIGNAKFAAYRTVMIYGFAVLLVLVALYMVFWLCEHGKPMLSVTDKFVLAYLVLTGISVISGGFYDNVLWGCSGWNMGLMSQVSFVLLYFFLSRFGRYYRLLLTVLCGAAAIVYGIGILHRLMIDPVGFYEGLTGAQKAQFLSTLGQATWYGSFLAVTLPVMMGVFLLTEKRLWRSLSGICMTLGFSTLVTQNSDSAYFGLAAAVLVFFVTAAEDRERMCRFTGMLTLLFGAGKVMAFLVRRHPNPEMEADFVTRLMWDSPVTWVLLVLCLCVTLFLVFTREECQRVPGKGTARKAGKKCVEKGMRRLARIVPVAVVILTGSMILVIYLQTCGLLPEAVAERLADISYFNWNDGWGNGRGRIWRFSVKMFSEENIKHKLFGIGPDCFSSYVSACYSEEAALLWGRKKLTNAHNEWLNILINGGILGVTAYLGIFLTAFYRMFRRHRQEVLLAAVCGACVSYMCYNFFCYQQVLCTPFIFMLMGMGEYMLREQDASLG